MAKKTQPVFRPAPPEVEWTKEEIEKRRQELFPNNPPPTLKQLKAMKKDKTKMEQKIFESGWWNGLAAKTTCCIIEVIPSTKKPLMWFNAFSGKTRQVVEVHQDDRHFIIDNQHGDGFHKVTEGMGSPSCGSKHFDEFKLIEYLEPAYWNRIYDEPQLAGETFIIEDYQERTNPEEFRKVKLLVQGLRRFQSMSSEEQIEHIRNGMKPQPMPNFLPGGKIETGFPQRLFNHKKDKR